MLSDTACVVGGRINLPAQPFKRTQLAAKHREKENLGKFASRPEFTTQCHAHTILLPPLQHLRAFEIIQNK